jgi:hypothetical protein
MHNFGEQQAIDRNAHQKEEGRESDKALTIRSVGLTVLPNLGTLPT